MFQFCETVISLIWDFYDQSQKARETEEMFTNKLQILVRKIVACKPKFLGEANQALKHQFAHHLRDPYFRVVDRGQCFAFPDSESFTQFRHQLAMMFGSQGKYTKAVQDQYLSHNSHKHQIKIDSQAVETAMVSQNWPRHYKRIKS